MSFRLGRLAAHVAVRRRRRRSSSSGTADQSAAAEVAAATLPTTITLPLLSFELLYEDAVRLNNGAYTIPM
eukprot:COSAG06_NODE_31005_length_528_cov_1.202797_1_plen_70_part_01